MSPVVFPIDRSKAVPLFQLYFVCVSVVLQVAFVCPHLFLINSFGVLESLCFVIVAFPGYIYYFLSILILLLLFGYCLYLVR